MVELQKPSRVATCSVGAHERALTAIPFPDHATHFGRNVTLPFARPGTARPRHRTELPLLEVDDESVERTVEDLSDVSTRNGMA
jgi:hypothetical protein